MKKIIVINDICTIGHTSLMVNIPLISANGITVYPIITSTLSRHSAFKDYYKKDQSILLSNTITDIINHNDDIDAIFIGYLGHPDQIKDIIKLIKHYNKAYIFIDPICGDNGKLYSSLNNDYINALKLILPYANLIKPNLTESCLLTDTTYNDNFTDSDIKQIINKLKLITKADIVLTGHINTISINTYISDNNITTISNPLINNYYPGTGDIFDSILISNILNNNDLITSTNKAINFVIKAINTVDNNNLYGCNIEQLITIRD